MITLDFQYYRQLTLCLHCTIFTNVVRRFRFLNHTNGFNFDTIEQCSVILPYVSSEVKAILIWSQASYVDIGNCSITAPPYTLMRVCCHGQVLFFSNDHDYTSTLKWNRCVMIQSYKHLTPFLLNIHEFILKLKHICVFLYRYKWSIGTKNLDSAVLFCHVHNFE